MKKYKVFRHNVEEIMEEQPLREFLNKTCRVTPSFLDMLKGLNINEGMTHWDSMTEITRLE